MALLLITSASVNSGSHQGFAGSWEAYDADDGSTIHVNIESRRIAGDMLFNLTWDDTVSGVCAMGPSHSEGVHGFQVQNYLFINMAWVCPGIADNDPRLGPWTWYYHPETDTLALGGGLVFQRVNTR